jgi:hypothetical protein
MSDRMFEVSLTSLAAMVLALIITAIGLAAAGIRWVNADMPLVVFLTVLAGLAVLVSGGGILLYFWGKNYMSRG